MIPRNVSVVILAVPDRPSHERLRASLDASDVAEYEFVCHPPGVPFIEHWRNTHERAARAETDLVVVLEDDVIVNRHLAWNVGTWRWTWHPEFAAGWIYNPGGYAGQDTWYKGMPAWFGTCGVVYRTAQLPMIIDRAYSKIQSSMAADLAVAEACHAFGRIRVHYPALVEHPDDVPSFVGNAACSDMRTSRGSYREEWRRLEHSTHSYLDQFGREQV
jgi:hypothetical protein